NPAHSAPSPITNLLAFVNVVGLEYGSRARDAGQGEDTALRSARLLDRAREILPPGRRRARAEVEADVEDRTLVQRATEGGKRLAERVVEIKRCAGEAGRLVRDPGDHRQLDALARN